MRAPSRRRGGIGSGIARGLLECSATVVIDGRNAEKNESAVTNLGNIGPPVSAVVLDVADEVQCRAAVAETVRRQGQLDILVNNAGVGDPTPPEQMSLAQWHAVIDMNLTATFMLSQIAYPELKKSGGGKIITIGSNGLLHRRRPLDCLRTRKGRHRAAR